MASVIVAWKGTAREREVQDSLLAYLERFATLSQSFLVLPPRIPRFSEMVADQRRQQVPEQPDDLHVDRTLTGRILIRCDVMEDRDAFAEGVRRAGLPLDAVEPGRDYPVTRVSEVALRGRDFRLYDPRRLYPGSDRICFLFLTCPEAPFLDGRIVMARPAAELGGGFGPGLRDADWYVECPFVHLRYVLEDWTFRLLAWVKHFFVPDLYWRGWGELDRYEEERAVFERLEAADGRLAARNAGFHLLMEAFRSDADAWTDRFAAIRAEEDAGDDEERYR